MFVSFLKVQRIPDWNSVLCVLSTDFSPALGASPSITTRSPTKCLEGTEQPNIILLQRISLPWAERCSQSEVEFLSLVCILQPWTQLNWSHQGIGIWREQLKGTGTVECLSPTWVMDQVAGVSSSIQVSGCALSGAIPWVPSWRDPWSLVPFIPSHFPSLDFQYLTSS